MNPIVLLIKRHLEAVIWIVAIIALALTSPVDQCYSLCLFHHLGISWCPGCGLGHSISWLFRGEIVESFNAHPLGIPALLIIGIRVGKILYRNYQDKIYSFNKYIQHG